jgi:hypothetical protein
MILLMRLLRQREYDQWTLNCTRTFVLNKQLKERVCRPSKVANRTLQQQCVLVEIRLSMDPKLLAIKVCSGEFRLLFVRQYVHAGPAPTNDALPVQLDIAALQPAAVPRDSAAHQEDAECKLQEEAKRELRKEAARYAFARDNAERKPRDPAHRRLLKAAKRRRVKNDKRELRENAERKLQEDAEKKLQGEADRERQLQEQAAKAAAERSEEVAEPKRAQPAEHERPKRLDAAMSAEKQQLAIRKKNIRDENVNSVLNFQKAAGLPVTYEDTSDGLWHAMPVELDGYNAAA